MVRLRDRRAYRLPTGTRLVARARVEGGKFDLLTSNNLVWGPGQAEYVAEPDDTITYRGKPTVWRVSDLLDTGADIPELAAGA